MSYLKDPSCIPVLTKVVQDKQKIAHSSEPDLELRFDFFFEETVLQEHKKNPSELILAHNFQKTISSITSQQEAYVNHPAEDKELELEFDFVPEGLTPEVRSTPASEADDLSAEISLDPHQISMGGKQNFDEIKINALPPVSFEKVSPQSGFSKKTYAPIKTSAWVTNGLWDKKMLACSSQDPTPNTDALYSWLGLMIHERSFNPQQKQILEQIYTHFPQNHAYSAHIITRIRDMLPAEALKKENPTWVPQHRVDALLKQAHLLCHQLMAQSPRMTPLQKEYLSLLACVFKSIRHW
jgi:hypothetical protein